MGYRTKQTPSAVNATPNTLVQRDGYGGFSAADVIFGLASVSNADDPSAAPLTIHQSYGGTYTLIDLDNGEIRADPYGYSLSLQGPGYYTQLDLTQDSAELGGVNSGDARFRTNGYNAYIGTAYGTYALQVYMGNAPELGFFGWTPVGQPAMVHSLSSGDTLSEVVDAVMELQQAMLALGLMYQD